MKTRVTILFWFRKNARLVGEKSPDTPGSICCRITVRSKDCEFLTGIKTTYGEWDTASGRVRGRSEAAKIANEQLVKMRDQLTDLAADLERQGKPFTAKRLRTLYKTDGSPVSMIELFRQFLTEQQSLVGVEISKATATAHMVRYGNLCKFLAAHKLTDLRPEEFTTNMADKYLYWLMGTRSHGRNTALKNLQNVSQVLVWGVRRELLDKNPMALYRYRLSAPKAIQYLTEAELEVLTTNPMPVPALDRVRDCFVFQCWTGLAYADLERLDVLKDGEVDANGLRVLRVTRAKSTVQKGYECVIPILPEAERLLQKYQGHLPVPSNQIYNRYLKQAGELCGIEITKMTTHVGRKTAGVLMLNRGVRMEVVSKFLGHSSVKMTEKVYAKILDNTLVTEFARVFGAPPAPVTKPMPLQLGEAPAPPETWAEWKAPEPKTPTRPAARIEPPKPRAADPDPFGLLEMRQRWAS